MADVRPRLTYQPFDWFLLIKRYIVNEFGLLIIGPIHLI